MFHESSPASRDFLTWVAPIALLYPKLLIYDPKVNESLLFFKLKKFFLAQLRKSNIF